MMSEERRTLMGVLVLLAVAPALLGPRALVRMALAERPGPERRRPKPGGRLPKPASPRQSVARHG